MPRIKQQDKETPPHSEKNCLFNNKTPYFLDACEISKTYDSVLGQNFLTFQKFSLYFARYQVGTNLTHRVYTNAEAGKAVVGSKDQDMDPCRMIKIV